MVILWWMDNAKCEMSSSL